MLLNAQNNAFAINNNQFRQLIKEHIIARLRKPQRAIHPHRMARAQN